MKKQFYAIVVVLGTACSLMAADLGSLETAREKLSPVLDTVLAKHCGEACPAYRIEAQKSVPTGSADDLGFETTDNTAQLKGVTVSVLVDGKTPNNERQALQRVVSYRVANLLEVPVSVRVQTLAAPTPAQAKAPAITAEPPLWKAHFAALVWPVSLLTLALLALAGLFTVLRHRSREALAAFERSQPKKEAAPVMIPEEALQADALLESRSADLAWYLEERIALGDDTSVTRVLEAYSAEMLSKRLGLTAAAIRRLAELTQSGVARKYTSDFHTWLESELDGAHWRRAREASDPIQAVNRLTDDALVQVLRGLKDARARALVMGSVSQQRWPLLLTQTPSAERVELGMALSQLDLAGADERASLRNEILAQLQAVRTQTLAPQGLVEDYSLYLSADEGKQLWQRLSLDSSRRAPRSVEDLITTSHPDSLRALSLSLDWNQLKALMMGLEPSSRERLYQALPKSLQERLIAAVDLASSEVNAEAPEFLVARAQFVGAYRNQEQRQH